MTWCLTAFKALYPFLRSLFHIEDLHLVSSTLSSQLQRVTYILVKDFRSLWSLPTFFWGFTSKAWCSLLIFAPFFYRKPTFLLITFDLYRNPLSDPTSKAAIIPITLSTLFDTFTPHSYFFLWTLLYKQGSTSRDTFSLISSPVVRTSDLKVSPVNPTGEASDQEECSYLRAQGSGVLSDRHLVCSYLISV